MTPNQPPRPGQPSRRPNAGGYEETFSQATARTQMGQPSQAPRPIVDAYEESNYYVEDMYPGQAPYAPAYEQRRPYREPARPTSSVGMTVGASIGGLLVGLGLMWGIMQFSAPAKEPAAVDPNTATPVQVADLNNQIAALHKQVTERDQRLATMQQELTQANKASITSADDAKRQADLLQTHEAELNQRDTDLKVKEADLVAREEALETKTKAVNEAIAKLEAISGQGPDVANPSGNGTESTSHTGADTVENVVDSLKNLFGGSK